MDEAMDVDIQLGGHANTSRPWFSQPSSGPVMESHSPVIIEDSGSSTEIEDEEELSVNVAPAAMARFPRPQSLLPSSAEDFTRPQRSDRVRRRLPARHLLSRSQSSGSRSHQTPLFPPPLEDIHANLPVRFFESLQAVSESDEDEPSGTALVSLPPPQPHPPLPLLAEGEAARRQDPASPPRSPSQQLPPLPGPPDPGPPAPSSIQESTYESAPVQAASLSESMDEPRARVQEATVQQADAESVAGPPASPSPPPEEEGEGEVCPICFEAWTTSGNHRLAALRCGHLFGYTCIDRWLRGEGAKCPQCNKKAKKTDIVLLYAQKLRAVDNTEQETLKRSLAQEQSLRRKAELECSQFRLKLQVSNEECNKLRKQMQELRKLRAMVGVSASQSQAASATSSGHYVFSTGVLVSQSGGCRVMAYCQPLGCLLASQPSAHSSLIPGFGVKKISTATMKACQYIPIHSKPIRGLAFSHQQDSLLLSGALDFTIKLTSLMTNTVVQTYNTGVPVWSCCWCHDNNNYVYAGLINGTVRVYDMRDTSTHVQELLPQGMRSPVASLSYLPRAASHTFPSGGLFAGSLAGSCFWEFQEGTTYQPHLLPLEEGNCTDIQVEPESRHCLVTCRPGRSNPSLRCVLMEMNRVPQGCTCSPVQTFTAGGSSKLLTKNAIFKSPGQEDTMLVCAGDEASQSTMVWNAGTGNLLQKLPADLPVLDICPFQANQGHYLASLTEKMVKIYKWE